MKLLELRVKGVVAFGAQSASTGTKKLRSIMIPLLTAEYFMEIIILLYMEECLQLL